MVSFVNAQLFWRSRAVVCFPDLRKRSLNDLWTRVGKAKWDILGDFITSRLLHPPFQSVLFFLTLHCLSVSHFPSLSCTVVPVMLWTVPPAVDLATVLTPEIMAPILSNSEVQERLLPYLPSGESLPQSASEIQNTLTSPQFQQVTHTHTPRH